MGMPEFPRDLTLKRLRKRNRYLRRRITALSFQIRRAKLRGHRTHAAELQVKLTRRRKQRHHVLYEIKRRKRTLRERLRIPKSGFVYVNGRLVCGWIAVELEKARRYGWKGYVVSGYRTPAYSEGLCYHMCNRPYCPGRCAGRNTNHARGPAYPNGAVDVTDYWNLQSICLRHGLKIHNALSRTDPVHFSYSGR